jgi:hypothetical protein
MKTLVPSNLTRFSWPVALLGAALMLSACGGGDTTGATGQSVALRTVPEAAGANCATGGTKIEAGPDSNANGVADTNEVNSTAYVCNGQAGLSGAVGAAGAAGPSGPAGAPGPSGPAGATGTTGLPGTPGATGAAGPAGLQGANGPAGPIGLPGAVGPTGPAGATGTTGPAGPIGLPGDVGPTGPAGATGTAGATGATGATGADGANGQNGAVEVCLVPITTAASVVLCGDKTTGPSTLFQAGVDLNGTGFPGNGDPNDPKGITSSVLVCGAGSGNGSISNPSLTDPTTGAVQRVLCGQFKN